MGERSVAAIKSKYILVNGMRTHYFESGEGKPLVLLHSGEFGACAALSWEFNFVSLARYFRVIAPDWVGFGKTAKVYCFEDMWRLRVDHITEFLRLLSVHHAHFIGNSMGGSTLIAVAALPECPWPLDRIVLVSGGGHVPNNDARKVLTSYDGSRDHMRRIVETMFINPRIRNDQFYVDRRHQLSLEPGAWECVAAARFKRPGVVPQAPSPSAYGNIRVPTLIVAGAKDTLRDPGYGELLQAEIAGSKLVVFPESGHCPQIDEAEEFNKVVIDFLMSSSD